VANWTLAVDLRAQGTGLVRTLREAAQAGRSLDRELTGAQHSVRTLGAEATSASRQVRTLGTEARQAGRLQRQAGLNAQRSGRELRTLGSIAERTGRQQRRAGQEAEHAGRGLRTLSREASAAARSQRTAATAAQNASRDFRLLARDMRTAVREMRTLARTSPSVGHGVRQAGRDGERAMGRFARVLSRTRSQLVSTGSLLAGGALFLGSAALVETGNELQAQLNTLRGVTGANTIQMARAGAVAKQLGEDLTLPKASAADAAEAMVDLAKAGFRADQSISAARAALELAAGQNVEAADAAKYLGDTMDNFGLSADKAGVAADTLSATAVSASGGIKDIWVAMSYTGPVANALGISLTDTAAAVAGLGKAGIIGSKAGTTLRGSLTNLAKPTDQMKAGLKTLGIEAFDSTGQFKGLAYIIGKLHEAEKGLSQQDFLAAAAKAFGKPGLAGMVALAHQGLESYTILQGAVSQSGKAAQIAGSQSRGLVGAMAQLKTQSKTTGQVLYAAMAPSLEKVTRLLTSGMAGATPHLEHVITYVQDLATLLGPGLASSAKRELSGIVSELKDLAGPLKGTAFQAGADGMHILLVVAEALADVLRNLARGVEPIVQAVGDLSSQANGSATGLDILVAAADQASSAVSALSGALLPVGNVIGGLVHLFGMLPGPVQTAVAAMLLTRRVAPMVNTLAGTVGGRLTGAWRSAGEQMRYQQTLAAGTGASIGRLGSAYGALRTSVPVVGRMSSAFGTARMQISNAGGALSGFRGTVGGVTAALGAGTRAGLSGAMNGLMGVMGGPWGVALTGLTLGLGMLASSQAEASAAAEKHKGSISDLAQAFRDSSGAINENVRTQAAQALRNEKLESSNKSLVSVLEEAGITLRDGVDAYLEQGSSINTLVDKLHQLAQAKRDSIPDGSKFTDSEVQSAVGQAKAYDAAAKSLQGMSGDAKQAQADAKSLAQATKGTDGGVTAYTRLKDAAAALADKTGDADSKTRALKDAIDLFNGGQISMQAATARMDSAILDANSAIADGIDKTGGYGRSLLQASGALDTTSRNGQKLYNDLSDVADAAAGATVTAYQLAQAHHKSLPDSLSASATQMQKARDAAITTAKAYGLNADQARGVADSLGLIPGQVAVLLKTEGVDSTMADLIAVQARLKELPKAKSIKVDALGADAQKQLAGLGFTVKTIPGSREVEITVADETARARLAGFLVAQGQVKDKSVTIGVNDQKSRAQLGSLQKKILGIKGRSVPMKALTKGAEQALQQLGFKVKHMPDGTVLVTVPPGPAKAGLDMIQGYIDGLPPSKTITVTINGVRTGVDPKQWYSQGPHKSYGGVIGRYAGGGTIPGYAPRRDTVPAMLSPGEGILVPEVVVKLGGPKAIAALNKWGRYGSVGGYAGGGVAGVQHFADGGFVYSPGDSRRSPSDVTSRYTEAHQPITKEDYDKALKKRADAVDTLRSAEARLEQARRRHRSHAQIVAAETAVAKARRNVTAATSAAEKAEARYRGKFSLRDYAKELSSSVRANAQWEANLQTVAKRGGSDVADILRGMGEDGAALVAALAKASNKQFADIIKNLKALAPQAAATLADYTAQLKATTNTSAAFQANLAKLAAMGFGDLAAQLAGQGDAAAEKIAADAVKNKKAAGKADKAAKASTATLSSDQLTELVQIIGAVRSSKTGIHDVADTTGLDEEEIITVAGKATGQIKKSLGIRSSRFLSDLTKAQKGLAYADGGIRAGMYATQGGIIRFAEPSTGGEAYLPLGLSKRPQATDVLKDVAGRFGYQLLGRQDAGAGATRVIVVQQDGPLIGHQSIRVDRPGATEQQIAAAVGYQVRRARRGGAQR
jgi:TP901 family phage tail tape measure protein